MLNAGTECFELACILKTMPKLDHLGVLLQELCVEGSRCFDVVSRLLLITPHSHIGWIPFPICGLLRKNTDSHPVTLDSSWS